MDSKAEPKLVVTLVHGTFARETEWIHPGSALRKRLEDPNPGVVDVRQFEWTGANRHTDRIVAGAALSKQIEEQLLSYPDAQHVLVGHSHGGNVALYAMRSPILDGRVAGIVCLNTPFICATPRSVASLLSMTYALVNLSLLLAACLSGALLAAIAAVHIQYAHVNDAWSFELIGYYYVLAPVFLISGVIGILLLWRRAKLIQWLKNRQEGLLETLQHPPITRTRIASVWTSSDEVYELFSALEGITTIPYFLLHPVVVLASIVCMWAFFVAANFIWPIDFETLKGIASLPFYEANDSAKGVMAILSLAEEHVGTLLGAQNLAVLRAILLTLFQTYFLSLLLILIAVGMAIVANLAMRLLPMGIGSYRFIDSLFVRLSLTLTPVTARRVTFLDLSTDAGFLKHTIIYNEPPMIDQIVRLIAETSRVPLQSPSSSPPASTT